jgi:hypothetical protein
MWSLSSSVGTVPGYRLEDRAIEVQSRQWQNDINSSLCVQTVSGAHPASCTMGTGGPFPGGKSRPGCDADYSLFTVCVLANVPFAYVCVCVYVRA